MFYLLLVIIFIFGAASGSFISVIANRYNTGLPFWGGRSICFSCNAKLQKRDLIPILSFFLLRGKCRYCQSKIPKETITIEILMGLLSILAALKSGLININPQLLIFNLQTIFTFAVLDFIFANILLITAYDLKHFIIPNSFLVSLFVLSFFYLLIFNSGPVVWRVSIFQSLLIGITLALPFFLIFLISKGTWFGFGDVKYILVLGFFLGFTQGLSAVILAFWIGAIFSVLALLLKKIAPRFNLPLFKNNLTIKSEVPFGPFLSLGIIISFCLNLDIFQMSSFLG